MPVYPAVAVLCGWFVGKLQDWFSKLVVRNPNVKIQNPNIVPNSKFKGFLFGFRILDLFRIWGLGFGVLSGRAVFTILVSLFLLVVGTAGLLLNRRMWFAENLNQQVAELSDAVWRLPGLEKKFYVADAAPPLPIFYSGRRVTTTDSNGLVAALYNPHVVILSKQGTYREVLRGLESDQLPPVIFAETEDYILYGR